MMARRVAVVLFNLGGPDAPESVRPFLVNLFSDPAILRVPGFIRPWLAKLIAWRLAAPLNAIRSQIEKISQGDFHQTLDIRSKDEFGKVAAALNEMSIGLQQRDDLKGALTRYVSEDILNEIIYAGKSTELFSKRKKVTILFADVRGFTNMS